MNAKERLEEYLRHNEVPYEVQHHPRAMTAQGVAASEHISGRKLAKVVMVRADGKLVMLVLPASEWVYLPQVAWVLRAEHAILADEREFALRFFDCEVGAMPPFGNFYDVPVYLDTTLLAEETLYFQAGTHTDTMSIRSEDYLKLVKPTVTAFSMEEVLLGR